MMNDGCQSGITSKTVDPLSAFRRDASHSAGSNSGAGGRRWDGCAALFRLAGLAGLAGWVGAFVSYVEGGPEAEAEAEAARELFRVCFSQASVFNLGKRSTPLTRSGWTSLLSLSACPAPCSGCRATREAAFCSLDARPPPAALPTFHDSTRLPH